ARRWGCPPASPSWCSPRQSADTKLLVASPPARENTRVPALRRALPAGRALIVASCAVGALSCLAPPGDEAQIRTLARDRAAAIARGDAAAFYRLHDLDFRAICPLERFRALPLPADGQVREVREIAVRGVRGAATVELAEAGGTRTEQREFV